MAADLDAVEPGQLVGRVSDVGVLYEQWCAQLRRRVRRDVRAPEALIDDACQVAWGRLVRDCGRVRRATAVSWLVTTAEHEAIKLLHRAEREVSLEALLELDDDLADGTSHAQPADEAVEARLRLESIGRLPERQQRLIWLQAFGLSYDEMAAGTGATRRTVERQLMRAKRELAREL